MAKREKRHGMHAKSGLAVCQMQRHFLPAIQLKDELGQIKMDVIIFLVRFPVPDSYPVTIITTRTRHIYMISEEARKRN